jgi:hypothetical protein
MGMRKLTKYIFIILSTIGIAGCSDYLDVNDNPNEPTTVPLSSLMATASFATGENIQAIGGITSYYVQYLASPNPSGSTDIQEPVAYDNAWFLLYHTLGDIADMEKQAIESGASHYTGAAKLLKAIHLQLIVDAWGDVPYTEALFAETVTPAYDEDSDLYPVILALISDGIAELSKAESTYALGAQDFIYGDRPDEAAQVSAWIKMGYALKARTLLHMSKTPGYDPEEVLAAVDNAFTSNADNADIVYFDTEFNPWASVARNQESLILDGWISEQLVQAMDGTSYGVTDPRMPFMFGDTDEGTFVGVPNGAGRGGADVSGERSVLERGTYYASDTSPMLIITYAELKFIEAEAALAADNKPRAYQAYLEGIEAHMDMVGVPDEDRDEYINDESVSVGSDNISIELIMKEKYIAMFLHPEAWTDARRYNFQYKDMTIPANLNPDLNGNFARRLVYPDSETGRNVANVPPVTQLDRMWWDVQN